MTPEWIKSNAEITGRHNVTQSYFEILPTTGDSYQRALRVPLIPPSLLASNDSITVVIIAAFDTTIGQTNDHDPNFGISDGKTFFGFEVPDPANYMNFPPCFSVSADVDVPTTTGSESTQVCNFYPYKCALIIYSSQFLAAFYTLDNRCQIRKGTVH